MVQSVGEGAARIQLDAVQSGGHCTRTRQQPDPTDRRAITNASGGSWAGTAVPFIGYTADYNCRETIAPGGTKFLVNIKIKNGNSLCTDSTNNSGIIKLETVPVPQPSSECP